MHLRYWYVANTKHMFGVDERAPEVLAGDRKFKVAFAMLRRENSGA